MFPRVTHPSATPPCEGVRLACVKPAASVRSEPGSNSQVVVLKIRTRLSHSSKARPLGPASRRVPKHIRQSSLRRTNTMNFGNVTVGEVLLPMPESIVSASQRTARTPPSTFLFLPMKLSNSVEAEATRNVQPDTRQTREDDNTPGKPCRAITHQTEAGSVETRRPLISSAAVDDRDIRDQAPPRQCPFRKNFMHRDAAPAGTLEHGGAPTRVLAKWRRQSVRPNKTPVRSRSRRIHQLRKQRWP